MTNGYLMFVALTSLVICGCGCSTGKTQVREPYLMILTRFQPGIGNEQHRIAFPETIAEWEQIFPPYSKTDGVRGVFCAASYEVIFMRSDGTASWVATSREIWTNGKGYFPVNGDVDALYAKTTNYLHYIDENWPRGEIQEDGSIRVNFRAELLEDGTLRRLDPAPVSVPEAKPAP